MMASSTERNVMDDNDRAQDLRDSVKDYRNPATPHDEREAIQKWWRTQGIPNQFAAMLKASSADGA